MPQPIYVRVKFRLVASARTLIRVVSGVGAGTVGRPACHLRSDAGSRGNLPGSPPWVGHGSWDNHAGLRIASARGS